MTDRIMTLESENARLKELLELWSDDLDFHSLVREIAGNTLVSLDRCYMLYQWARYAKQKAGQMAEVGVYKGGTAKLIAKTCPDKAIHLFDTFSGLPQENPSIDLHRKGNFGDADLGSVQKYLKDCQNVLFHFGFFPDTASGITADFCFVHVDVDIYESVKDSLEFFYEKMVPGGVMIFDDYEWKACPGVKKAIDEFLLGNPEVPVITAKYQCMLIKAEKDICDQNSKDPMY